MHLQICRCAYKPQSPDKHHAVAVLMIFLWVSEPKVLELCLIIPARPNYRLLRINVQKSSDKEGDLSPSPPSPVS